MMQPPSVAGIPGEQSGYMCATFLFFDSTHPCNTERTIHAFPERQIDGLAQPDPSRMNVEAKPELQGNISC